jgi:DNA-binding MurR/RpiR family transcriptional regulator
MPAKSQDEQGAADLGVTGFAARFDRVARSGSPGLRRFAAWLADQPEELAFHTVRGIAEVAGTDPNIVVRTVKAAGFSGFSEARKSVQQALREADQGYVSRADALQQFGHDTLPQALSEAAQSNLRKAFAPAMLATIEEIVPQLISARRVHCVGVRMAYSLAHYFTYRGGIAHDNVVPAPSQPGVIFDSLMNAGPEDVVVVISFAHYSSEVVRAAALARARKARLVAITDRGDSPLAEGAWRVLRAPVAGPNVMYSITGAMMIVEILLELIAARDPRARARIEAFERGLLDVGAYIPANR